MECELCDEETKTLHKQFGFNCLCNDCSTEVKKLSEQVTRYAINGIAITVKNQEI